MSESSQPANVGSMEGLGRCVTCKHWQRYTDTFDVECRGKHAGTCNSKRFVYDEPLLHDGLRYWDQEGYSAGFATGENFGCVHWTAA